MCVEWKGVECVARRVVPRGRCVQNRSPSPIRIQKLPPTAGVCVVAACSEAWGVRGFVHLNQWTVKLSIPVLRQNANKGPDEVHPTAPDREL
eukprot:COSAG01_NODE_10940_length_2042_cov_1.548354_4_plen_92_part_00